MQSISRRNKRILSGRQNPMPNSQKVAKCSMNNPAVFRTRKFILDKSVLTFVEPYNPADHLY